MAARRTDRSARSWTPARFNSLTVAGSVMQQRHVFTGVPLLTGDKIEFTLDVVQT
jgi:hypothetical protein